MLENKEQLVSEKDLDEENSNANSMNHNRISYIIKSTIMAGLYISLGAILFLAIPDRNLAPFFFPLGILLVTNYHSMMVTRIVPMYLAKIDYKLIHIPFAMVGNVVGALISAILLSQTRVVSFVEENLEIAVSMRLEDNLLSIFILSIFCGALVAYSTLTSRKYKKGSFAQIFYTVLFIIAFIFCGFDHIVAISFFYGLYGILNGFSMSMLITGAVIMIGNMLGGAIIALIEKGNLDIIETRRRYEK